MGLVERVPAPALRWAGRQQFRPVIGPVVKALSGRLARGPRTVAHGRAAGLRIDPRGAAAGYALGTSEPLIQDAFAELVRPGAVVWDVGANIGFYTLIAARLVERGRVIAFEPLPENQAAIRANLELNGLTNVELAGIALADRAGDAELQMHGESTWAKLDTSEDTSFKRGSDATGSVPVEVSTLDAQLERFPAPDVVKIDIEGAEVAALRGASRLLEQCRPTLICELHGTNGPVTALLTERGYDVRTVETPDVPPERAAWYAHVIATPAARP
ncbi:MAG TPA: FkbM family methyltransferase [Solirubrobacteraceae bacterium]|jgi:FkbM family methyltransferase|nr:FkbM family methyltransferase [Solirubrobacteraceae bacterium]